MRGWLALLCAALCCASVVVPATASTTRVVDLRGDAGTRIAGGGGYVSAAGDINGDGKPDVLLSDCGWGDAVGRTTVLFGPIPTGRFTVSELVSTGFFIVGVAKGSAACAIDGGDDVNGDGFDDIVVGQIGSDQQGETGTTFVIFGRDSTQSIDLADIASGDDPSLGFAILPPDPDAETSTDPRFAGDVNGDGLADVILGGALRGNSYVVFGKNNGYSVSLADFDTNSHGAAGFRIDTPKAYASDMYAVASAGDVNADGLSDVVVGVVSSQKLAAGSANVVFGKADPLPVDVTAAFFAGFRIRGVSHSNTGGAVAAIGDVDFDGRDDLLVGASGERRTKAYLVYGKDTFESVDLAVPDSAMRFLRAYRGDSSGKTVAGAGDINGDGRPDAVIGAPFSSFGRDGGSVYVIFRGLRGTEISLGALGRKGMRIDAEREHDQTGTAEGAGDLNGDGCDDLLVGASYGLRAYVVAGC